MIQKREITSASGASHEQNVFLDAVPLGSSEHSFSRRGEPVSIGLPFPRRKVVEAAYAKVTDPHGHQRAAQVTVLDKWPDGSVRWALADFKASLPDSRTSIHRFELTGADSRRQGDPPTAGIRVETLHTEDALVIDTGAALFRLTTGSFPFSEVLVKGQPAMTSHPTCLAVEGSGGVPWSSSVDRIVAVQAGFLRTVVQFVGKIVDPGGRERLQLDWQLEFFAESAAVRCSLTLRNSRRAKHPGGIWVLGDAGSVYVRDVSLTIGAPSRSVIRCSSECGNSLEEYVAPFELYQDSSGGEQWPSSNHVNRKHVVPLSFRGYRLQAGDITRSGLRATPILSLKHASGELSVAIQHFWQNFPKALEATSESITLRLFPRQYADLHEIQGGEQKTHVFVLAFGPDPVTDIPLEWVRQPALVRARPEWYASSHAVRYLVPKGVDPNGPYRGLIDAAIGGTDTFERKREVVDEYGWRHFGDIYGDHEGVRAPGEAPLVSHYNNQYDAIAGFARQFMSTGDPRWWAYMNDLARHVVDIDIYHTDEDKAAYNRGLFWHTVHYIDADTSTHRSYPRLPGVGGGGPAAEHNYTTGLMLHYFLTGETKSRDAAIGLARFVIDMDDGRKSLFRWLDRGPTGLATASGSLLYQGPGRGSANSLNALIDGHRLTAERRFLMKAEELIRRCVHPNDGLKHLLDPERKWFYTMFLQSLGKYLDYKEELNELDAEYGYGRACLLHYARWMAGHEYPYLDKPELLEFPTETWAAQDIRKSDVFNFAACHVSPSERTKFLERAKFFFEYSISTLKQMPTHTLARPVVVLLTSGVLQSFIQLHGVRGAPPPDVEAVDYGAPQPFVPQRVRVVRRLKAVTAALAALGLAGAVYFVLR